MAIMAWPGGKDGAGVAQQLINEIPPHKVFVSAFLGDCAILRRKRPASANIGIDLDRANVERWANRPPIAPLQLFCCSSIEWLRHRFGCYQVAEIGVSVRAAECGGEVLGDACGAENGGDRRRNLAGLKDHATAALSGDLVGNVAASSGSQSTDAEAFVYADPPYMLSSRRSKGRLYEHELTDDQHVELLTTLKMLPCNVMVSHYPCDLYDRALAGWRSFTFTVQTRGGAKATEKVWCNYPQPAVLHDPRYLGRNKRQRERIRRRVRNWSQGLARMHPLERQAILDAIKEQP